MQNKNDLLMVLSDEYHRWEELLGGLNESQITAKVLESQWSIKDVMAHLAAWQSRSIARVTAALSGKPPSFPSWPADLNPESEEDVPRINDWIYASNKDRPWRDVYRGWREGFMHFLELGQAVPEKDLFSVGRYDWLPGYPLSLILQASYEHHAEHYDWLTEFLNNVHSG